MKLPPSSLPSRLGLAALLASAIAPLALHASAEVTPSRLPAPVVDDAAGPGLRTAIFAGGCFWGVQGVFEHVKGVRSAESGYTGGSKATASYEVVSTGATGHAEAVKVVYDPSQVSYGTLTRVFFSVVLDPTQVDRQGPDSGRQYRSELFYTTTGQKAAAESYVAQLQAAHVYRRPIATRIEAAKPFYTAEAYHQDFLVRHPDHAYIAAIDLPKVEALKALFPGLYRAAPVALTAKL